MTRPSIKSGLIASLGVALLALYGLTAAGVYLYVAAKMQQQFDAALKNELRDFVAETRIRQDGTVEAEFHEIDLSRYQQGSEAAFYQLWNQEKITLLKSPSLPVDQDLPVPASPVNEIEVVSVALPGGAHGRLASMQFPLDAEPGKTPPGFDPALPGSRVVLAVAHRDSEVRSMLRTLAGALSISGMVLAFLGVVTVLVVVERALRPLHRFGAITAALDPDNLHERLIETEAPAELHPFLRQINAMLDRVEAGLDRERRFSASVAHELRTPVAELRNLVEVALTDCDDESLRENPDDVYRSGLAIALRMGVLIESLSALLRKCPVAPRDLETVAAAEIVALVRDAIERYRGAREARHIAIHLEIGGNEETATGVAADPALCRALLDNLLSNAIWHAPENTEVSVRAGQAGPSGFEIEISNAQKDLTDADLKCMTRPFWQKDAARSDPNRFGLGLALAVSYAELMGATLHLELRGERFVARLCLGTAPLNVRARTTRKAIQPPELAVD